MIEKLEKVFNDYNFPGESKFSQNLKKLGVKSTTKEIKDFLVNKLGKGITVYKGERGYLPGSFNVKTDCDIIVTIVSRLEIKQIQDALKLIDPKVFIFIQSINEASGGVLKAKSHAH